MLLNKTDIIHIIGIGGIGMSGIAEIMSKMGYRVQGSDANKSNNTKRLEKKNIKVFIGHKKNNVKRADIVFFSTAIKNSNIEMISARENNIPTLPRFKILSHLSSIKNLIQVIIIAACIHSKCSTYITRYTRQKVKS